MKKRLVFWLLMAGCVTPALFLLSRHHRLPGEVAAIQQPGTVSTTAATPSAPLAAPIGERPRASRATAKPGHAAAPSASVIAAEEASASTAAIQNFAAWAAQFNQAGANVVEGQRLAWKRREAMLGLIQTDPERALELAAPFSWRQQLPAAITQYFEQQLDGRGNFTVAMGTGFASQGAGFASQSAPVYRAVQLGQSKYQAFVYGRRLAQPCLTGVPLHGIALDGKMAVSSEPLRVLTPDEAAALAQQRGQPLDQICGVSGNSINSRKQPVYAESGGGVLCCCGDDHFEFVKKQWILAESGGTAGTGDTGVVGGNGAPVDDSWTHGTKTLLYMRVNFPDDLTEPITEADAYAQMDVVDTYYTTVSYNLASLDTTVAPLVTLPQTKAYYSADPSLLRADAQAATKLAGYDTANYDRDIVAFTPVQGYNFGGLAYVGAKGVWLQTEVGGQVPGTASHELGHNYGVLHANFWANMTNFSMVGPGTNLEYGNIYDVMGNAYGTVNGAPPPFDAPHRNQFDWLKAGDVQTVTSNGVYRIYPFDVPASSRVAGRTYAAAVQKDALRYYWLEFRQGLTSNPWNENGLLLNWDPWLESNAGTQLIDTTPGSPDAGDSMSRDDAAVVIGRTFNDYAAGVHITPLQRGSSGSDPWIECQVNMGAFPGNRPPAMTLLVDNTNVAPGALVTLYTVASDPDGDPLAYAWWFDDLTFSTNNLPWIAKKFTTPGDHVVRCMVSDMKGGQASANAVITVGSPAGFRVTGRVTDVNGAPLEGVLVSDGMIDPSQFIGGWTDSDGRYVLVNTGSTNFDLNVYQDGYSFAATNWSGPLLPTNNMANVNFVGTPLPAVNITLDTNVVAETDGSTHYFTINLIGETNNDVDVLCDVSGTATLGVNYTMDGLSPGTNIITIPAGTNSVTVAFHALNNSLLQGPETASLTLVDDMNYTSPGYALAPLAEATITITDPHPPATPTVNVTAATPEISNDGIDTGELVFTLNGPAQSALVVNYSVSGTAVAGTDYAPLAGSIMIPAGQSGATVFLEPLNNQSAAETNASVTVALKASPTYSWGVQPSDTITILEQNVTTVTVYPSGSPATEPSSPGYFTFQRDGDLTESLAVNYTVGGTAAPGADYSPLSGSVTIPAGAATANVTITPLGNTAYDTNDFVTLTITNALNYDAATPSAATLFIQSELPSVTISAPVSTVSEQGNTFGEFMISRTTTSGALTVNMAISGTAVPGFDYLPLSNQVVIPDGASSVTIEVIPFQNSILAPANTVELTILPGTNYNIGDSGPPNTAILKITSTDTTDPPGVGFCFATSQYPESESPGIAVTLSTTSSVPVTVDYAVIGGSAPPGSYSLPQGTLTLANTQVAMIPLQIVDGAPVTPPETVQVVLYNPVNATLGPIRVHTYTILNDTAAAVSVTATVPNASEIGPVPGNFRISRTGSTNASQLVNFQITGSATAPADYASLGSSVTIPAGSAYIDLPVLPTRDLAPRMSQTVVLELIHATNSAIVAPNVATVTIADTNYDTLPIVAVTSTNHAYAVAGGANGAFLFTRSGPTNAALAISFTVAGTASAGVRYTALPSSVTIPAGQTSVSLPVVALDDHQVEGEETVVVALSQAEAYQSAYPSSATVTVQDGDEEAWINASIFDASKYGPVPGQFTISRFGTTNTSVTIQYVIGGTATNGFDYVAITNSIVIPAGQLTVELPIVPLHTGVVAGPETVTLTLLTNASYSFGAPVSATVIIDDDEPMLTISTVVSPVLEGSGSNGVFRVTRTGNPQFDFTAYLGVSGTAVYGVDYAPFPTNIYFSCGVTSIDLYVTPTNDLIVDGDHTVEASLLPNPAYTVLAPSNAVLTITDAGTNMTPLVIITNPASYVAFLDGTNPGLVLGATIIDANPTNDILTWSEVSGPTNYVFGNTNEADTTVQFSSTGVYVLQLEADNGVFQGYSDIIVFVTYEDLSVTNILHWPLDDGAGTNVADTSGYGRDGVFSGSPAWLTNGVSGGALQFFGTNDCVRQDAGSNTLNGLNAFTVALWIKPADAANRGFLTADDADTNATFGLSTRSIASCGDETNVVEASFATTGGVAHRASASNVLRPGQWEFIALSWTNGEAPKLYLNGILDQPNTGFLAVSGVLTNCPQFIIGKGSLENPASWLGALDDVRVFNVALDADEILALAYGPVTNHAPVVNAGTNVTVQIGVPVTLAGTVTQYDGQPYPPGEVTTIWSYFGTNNIVIPDPSSLTNTLTFQAPGVYIFQLTAADGPLTAFADVTVTVIPPTEVDILADISDAYDMGPVDGDFTVMQTGDTNALTVYFTVTGTSSNGVDYVTITNLVTIPAGSNFISVPVDPILNYRIKGDQTVILTIVTNLAYYIGNGQAIVTIHDSPYGLWSITNFTLEELTEPEVSGAGADPANDGVANFAKYAFGQYPFMASANPPYKWDFERDTNDNLLHLTLTYSRILPPRVVQYGVYVSTDMVTWNTGTNYVEDFWTTNNPDGLSETVKTRALLPFPATQDLFMNIRVWLEQVPGP